MAKTLAATKVSLVVTKATLVVVKVVLVGTRVLEQCPGNYQTKYGHSQAGCTTQVGGYNVD